MQDIAAIMHPIGRAPVAAAHVLALAPTAQKAAPLAAAAAALRAREADILAANARDMKAGEAAGLGIHLQAFPAGYLPSAQFARSGRC